MKTKVLFFGVLTDVVKSNKIEVSDVKTTEELMLKVKSDYPEIEKYTFRIFVNKDQVSGNKTLKEGDEIALLPPFAGG